MAALLETTERAMPESDALEIAQPPDSAVVLQASILMPTSKRRNTGLT